MGLRGGTRAMPQNDRYVELPAADATARTTAAGAAANAAGSLPTAGALPAARRVPAPAGLATALCMASGALGRAGLDSQPGRMAGPTTRCAPAKPDGVDRERHHRRPRGGGRRRRTDCDGRLFQTQV